MDWEIETGNAKFQLRIRDIDGVVPPQCYTVGVNRTLSQLRKGLHLIDTAGLQLR
jgi:hypothetical protein